MGLRFLLALALAVPAGAAVAQPPSGRKPDPTAELLARLRKPVDIDRVETGLAALASLVTEKYGVTALVNETAFKMFDQAVSPGDLMVKVPAARSASLVSVLPRVLGPIGTTFLVFKDHIEFVPILFAARETKNLMAAEDDSGAVEMRSPLVSMIFKERPLNEAVAEVAEEYNLTVVVLPQSGDARTGFVTARLLNVPADKALEILALQSDLRVIRKANAFLITTRDHANDLLGEEVEHERQKIDLEKFRAAPYMPPQPPPPQPQPQPQPPAAVPPPPPKNP
jgi:hypothetical protein